MRGVRRQSHPDQQLHGAALPLGSRPFSIDIERLPENPPDGHPGIQGSIRILKNHLHMPPQLTQPASARMRDVLSPVHDLPGRRLYQPEDAPSQRRLPAP